MLLQTPAPCLGRQLQSDIRPVFRSLRVPSGLDSYKPALLFAFEGVLISPALAASAWEKNE